MQLVEIYRFFVRTCCRHPAQRWSYYVCCLLLICLLSRHNLRHLRFRQHVSKIPAYTTSHAPYRHRCDSLKCYKTGGARPVGSGQPCFLWNGPVSEQTLSVQTVSLATCQEPPCSSLILRVDARNCGLILFRINPSLKKTVLNFFCTLFNHGFSIAIT
jgi:hypothetical protein